MTKKVIVVGGVAGGANFCTRARRLNEQAEILLVERGPYVSFANCGLPYHIGGEIKERSKLLLHTPESLASRFNITIRIKTEVTKIYASQNEIELREVDTGRIYREKYDELVLSPGAAPITPPLSGITAPGVFTLRTIENLDDIMRWLGEHQPTSAVVVGGGYIGLEVAEQLHKKVKNLTIIEAAPQLLAPLDSEMAILVEQEILGKGITVLKGDGIVGINEGYPLTVLTNKGKAVQAELVILAIGVKPEVSLAKDAGLAIGARGGIAVNEFLQTSVPNIWAVGDAIEVQNVVTEELAPIPLAGPANRQGRMVADNIFGTRRGYRGTLGTAIVRAFGLAVATTGANERTLKRIGKQYKSFYFYPNSHAGYYPGATTLSMKVLVDPVARTLLGAQVIGKEGVDKRVDVLATAILSGLTVDDIAALELSYAPPFGSAKDPVNIIGMAAQNTLDGIVETLSPFELEELLKNPETCSVTVLDVRDEDEFLEGAIPGALSIPLPQLRSRLATIPKDKEIVVYCMSGQRSYYAARILMQSGFRVRNLTGAYRVWDQVRASG
jgi:NADPH-dependent 2,4-dienoyl-CoA reductase/sulfur reductase-like enzyme/rhodanese-related sulfurtransferase